MGQQGKTETRFQDGWRPFSMNHCFSHGQVGRYRWVSIEDPFLCFGTWPLLAVLVPLFLDRFLFFFLFFDHTFTVSVLQPDYLDCLPGHQTLHQRSLNSTPVGAFESLVHVCTLNCHHAASLKGLHSPKVWKGAEFSQCCICFMCPTQISIFSLFANTFWKLHRLDVPVLSSLSLEEQEPRLVAWQLFPARIWTST